MTEKKKYIFRFRAVNQDIWQAIKIGKKRVETRAATVKYKNIKVGDRIIFSCQDNRFERTVKKVKKYNTIKSLSKDYKVKDINPNLNTVAELIKSYHNFPGYKDKIKKYGIMAIEFK